MSQIVEFPIEAFSWDKDHYIFSISRKDFKSKYRSAELPTIRVRGKIASVDFTYDHAEARFRFKSTHAVHDTEKWWNTIRALVSYRIEII